MRKFNVSVNTGNAGSMGHFIIWICRLLRPKTETKLLNFGLESQVQIIQSLRRISLLSP